MATNIKKEMEEPMQVGQTVEMQQQVKKESSPSEEKDTFEVNNDDILMFDPDENESKEDDPSAKAKAEHARKKGLFYYRPSKSDFKQDENAVLQERTVIVGPLDLSDSQHPKIQDEIKNAETVYFKFKKDTEGVLKGYIQFQCESNDNAMAACERLRALNLKDSLIIERETKDFQKTTEFTGLLAIMSRQQQDLSSGKGKLADRTLCLSGIPADTTVDKIKEVIPEAEKITLHFKDTLNPPGFAYCEFASTTFANTMANKTFTFQDNPAKLLPLLEVPALHILLKSLNSENFDITNVHPLDRKRQLQLGEYVSHLKYFIHKDPTHKERPKMESYLTQVKQYLGACRGMHSHGGNSRGGFRGGRGGPGIGDWHREGMRGRGGMMMRGGPMPYARGARMRGPRGPRGGPGPLRGRGGPGPMSILRGISSMLEYMPEEYGYDDYGYSGGYGDGWYNDYPGDSGYGTRKRTYSGGPGGNHRRGGGVF